MLLEREEPLALLHDALMMARKGRGHTVLVCGDPGIGKTSLIEKFTHSQTDSVRVLWGACDALATPRPLGPLYDMAHELGAALRAALDAGCASHQVFQLFIDELRTERCATIVVVEDAHWADDATAEFVKVIARRIARYPALLIITFRDEELPAGHPFMRAIGNVPADHVSRVCLHALSPQAVRALEAAYSRTIPNLHAITDGNPLLVTELLRSSEQEYPASLRQAVLTRLHSLSPAARDLADLVSVVPDRLELTLLVATAQGKTAALQECADRRALVIRDEHVRYPHELTRRIAEESLPETRRRALNAIVLQQLARSPPNPKTLTRLVHHALAARDTVGVLSYAPRAAEEAARRGAHRQAASLYRSALRDAEYGSARERASMLEKLATECRLAGLGDEALDANARAFVLWCEQNDTLAQGANRRARFEMLHINLYRRGDPEFSELARSAVRLLEQHGASAELAKAYMSLAFVRSMGGDLDQAQTAHDCAIATAEALSDELSTSHTLLQGELRKHSFFAEPSLTVAERALRFGLQHGNDPHAAHAYFCLAMFASTSWKLDLSVRFITEGLRFAEQRDLDGHMLLLRGFKARAEFLRGEWDNAKASASHLLATRDLPGIAEFSANMVLGAGFGQRGEACARQHLERLLELSKATIMTRISRVFALVRLAEFHWLGGDCAKALEFAHLGADESSLMRRHPWVRGQAAFWLWRTGGTVSPSEPLAPPYALQLSGDWAGAAAAWAELGCPYERAMALIDGDAAAQREAIAVPERLGATASLRRCRELLVTRGVTRIPRGPRPTTRGNPLGLTAREMKVLTLLAQGLQNREIGGHLYRSEKTIEHHVAAILAKLKARTRHEAVTLARSKGILERT